MIKPARWDFHAYRGTPFVEIVPFVGFDFTGATFAMDVRIGRDQASGAAALIALTNAASNAQGISVTVTWDDDDVPTSFVQFRINETTLEPLLLAAAGPGKDIKAAQDFHATGSGLPKTRMFEGDFIIHAGSTQQ